MLALGFTVKAQEESEWNLSSFQLSKETNIFNHHSTDQMSFYRLIDEEIDFTGFDTGNIYYNSSASNVFNLGLGFSKKKGRELFFNFTWSTGGGRGISLFSKNSISVDTFYSGGHTIIIDSVEQLNWNINEENEHISIGISSLYKTSDEKNLILWAGYGISLGYTMHSSATAYLMETSYSSMNFDGNEIGSNYYGYDFGSESKTIELPASMFTRIFLPMGIDIRFSKTDSLFSKLYLKLQAGFGFEHQLVIGEEGYLRSFSNFGMGLNYKF